MEKCDKIKNNIEVSKLVEYAYDLHEKALERSYYYCEDYDFPSYEFYDGSSCPVAKIDGGIVLGYRGYANHSDPTIHTTLGVCIGENGKDKFNLEFASFFSTTNKHNSLDGSKLKIINSEGKETLEYDHSNYWTQMTYEEKKDLFVKTMQYVGFRKEDVISVINGEITARKAFENVAPDDIKKRSWVNKYRRHYVFEDNVAVEGNYGSVELDKFPFPFDKQPILDCSKVETACVRFGDNKNKVKLINVNQNRESIIYTDIKNAIIEEEIDLSKIDATDTIFGNHKVINVDKSIAPLNRINLTYALNEQDECFVVDENGNVLLDRNNMPKTYYVDENEAKVYDIKVFSNADNIQMAEEACKNEADGIGLVRTEYMFENNDDIKAMVEYFIIWLQSKEKQDIIKNKLKCLQKRQINEVLNGFENKKIIFRLLDFKVAEFMQGLNLSRDEYDETEENIEILRGAALLENWDDILYAQLDAIFEELSDKNMEINLLVPLVYDFLDFEFIEYKIRTRASEFGINNLRIGAMIENLTSAKDADKIAKIADFISIGTNDLTESITGMKRNIYSDEFKYLTHEVKNTIKNIVRRAKKVKPDISIGICGEHCNYPQNIEFYKNLNIEYITCGVNYIKTNKKLLQQEIKEEKGISKVLNKKGVK